MTRSIDDMIHDSRRAEESVSEEKPMQVTTVLVLAKGGEMEELTTFTRGFLEHATRAPSQYDGTCRRMAAHILAAEAQLAKARAALETERERRKQQDQREASLLDDLSQAQRERDEARAALEEAVQDHVTIVNDWARLVSERDAALSQAQRRIGELEGETRRFLNELANDGEVEASYERLARVIGLRDADVPLDTKRCAAHPWFHPEPGSPCCFCVQAASPIPAVAQREERYDAGYAEGVRNEVALRLRCQEELSQAQRRIAELEAELCVAWSHDDTKYAGLTAASPIPAVAQREEPRQACLECGYGWCGHLETCSRHPAKRKSLALCSAELTPTRRCQLETGHDGDHRTDGGTTWIERKPIATEEMARGS